MIPQKPAQTDPDVRRLAREVARLRRKVIELEEADPIAYTSIEAGSLDVYDDDGNLVTKVGLQDDGSYGITPQVEGSGTVPEQPTEPDVIPVSGGAVVVWDGEFESPQTTAIHRVAVHVSEDPLFEVVDSADETSDAEATEKAAIMSPRGGSAFLALDPGGTYYVRLTAVAESGLESTATAPVDVFVGYPEGAFWQDHFELPADGAQTLTLTYEPLPGSEHLYWNGLYQREDLAWTRIGTTVSLTDVPTPPAVGDVVVVEYAYLSEPESAPQDFTVAAWYSGGSAGSIAVPGAVQVGDLAVVAVTGAVSVTDPRLTQVAEGAVSSAGGPGTAEVWVGTMTDLTALAVANNAGGSGGTSAVVTWLRGVDRGLVHDGRVALDGPRQGGTGAVPALAGPGSGQVLAAFGISGMYGSAVGGGAFSSWPAFLEETLGTGSYWVTGVGVDHAQDGSPSAPLMVADPEDGWFVVMLGVM